MFSRQQAAALMKIKKKIDKTGAVLAAIGSGTPEQAKDFVGSFAFEGEMYVDPSLKVFQAFKLARGFWRTLGPSSLGPGITALKKGFRQGRSAGDLWQQGGVFVIAPGDRVLFEHRNSGASDNADLSAVVKACASK